jgi:putative Ca2+/H+ antiporter (TMEM165/GDT1 family)
MGPSPTTAFEPLKSAKEEQSSAASPKDRTQLLKRSVMVSIRLANSGRKTHLHTFFLASQQQCIGAARAGSGSSAGPASGTTVRAGTSSPTNKLGS